MNRLQQLRDLGQSIWLDYIRRDLITSGELQRLITEDGVTGLTSNPTIFEKALSSEDLYDASIRKFLKDTPEIDSPTLFEKIAVEDLQMAADLLRPIYEETDGNDGFVSIEVSPHLAYSTERTILEARRLWSDVDRRNLMVKVPATTEGLPAIEALVAEGINVNVTLMFSVSQYDDVAQAYLRGVQRNVEPHKVTSVASFFVSRVDTAVDRALEDIGTPEALALRGKAGIANASMAYRRFQETFLTSGFEKLAGRGVRIQKPLWASTSTKNKALSDVMYVEGLIGPHTINSMPPETLAAFRDHGQAKLALGDSSPEAEEIHGKLLRMEINLRSVGQELTEEGVDKFVTSYDKITAALDKKRSQMAETKAA